MALAILSLVGRLTRFAGKPRRSQFRSFAFRWLRLFPAIPLPLRLPFGAWWLARNDHIGASLLEGTFEGAEYRFVERFLQPGMIALDIGANQGYYTLLFSLKVGHVGRVLAFEPSEREMSHLKLHLKLNHCKNVETCSSALGAVEETGQLHVVLGTEIGCNSLRPPEVSQPTARLTVRVERLDDVLRARGLARVDFIKLDVEGAELSVLQGAQELLTRTPRPVILAEVQDIRTKPWGYRAREIVAHVAGLGYKWYKPRPDEMLEMLSVDQENYDGNFVAVPQESVASLQHLIFAPSALH